VCWAQGRKDRLLASCSEGRCSESLRVCAIREIGIQLRVLQDASKPSCAPLVGGQGMPTPAGYAEGPTPRCDACDKPLAYLGMFHGQSIHGHRTLGECQGNIIEQILDKLACIGCRNPGYCDGYSDSGPVTKDSPPPTRCHRCAAVRLARGVVKG
jgi:hypothetical protein